MTINYPNVHEINVSKNRLFIWHISFPSPHGKIGENVLRSEVVNVRVEMLKGVLILFASVGKQIAVLESRKTANFNRKIFRHSEDLKRVV